MLISTPISTNRLYLRNLEATHAGGPYLGWMQDQEVLRFLESRFVRNDLESITAFISDMNESTIDLLLGIFLRNSNKHIGNIKLGSISAHHLHGNIGIMIGSRIHWSQGYASEAIDALSIYAGKELGLHRAYATCHSNNPGSCFCFLKAGFTEEGRMREHARVDGEWVGSVIFGRILST